MDWFTKACLVMIVLLLAVIAFRPMIFPQSAAAQQRDYKYVAVSPLNPTRPQPELDKYAADGWELAGAYMTNLNNISGAVLIFRK